MSPWAKAGQKGDDSFGEPRPKQGFGLAVAQMSAPQAMRASLMAAESLKRRSGNGLQPRSYRVENRGS